MIKFIKGFTLIELLAVIAILAVILLIAFPSITGVITKVKLQSFIDSVKIIEKSLVSNYIDGEFDSDIEVGFTNGEMVISNPNFTPKFSGKLPQSGKIIINKVGESYITVANDEYCITKSFDSKEYTISQIDVSGCEVPGNILAGDKNSAPDKGYIYSDDSETEVIEVALDLSSPYQYGDYVYAFPVITPGYTDHYYVKYTGDGIQSGDMYIFAELFGYDDGYSSDYYQYTVNPLEGVAGNKKITIENGITNIGPYAFYNNQVTNITMPNSVTSIGDSAFCSNALTNVIIPNGVLTIDTNAFKYNTLTNVVIPNGVQIIGDMAFWNNLLASVNIPNSVISIGQYAFELNMLTTIIIPDSITSIEFAAFANNILTTVTIPNTVTSIGILAFEGNLLTSITIPNSVTTIGDLAFWRNSLTNISIPASVTSIGSSAFKRNLLTSINIENPATIIGAVAFNDNQMSDANAFIYARNPDGSTDNTTLVGYAGSKRSNVVIPNGVTTIGGSAFANTSLTSITIPNGITTIGGGAFFEDDLTTVTIPNTVTTIGDGAFKYNHLNTIVMNGTNIVIGDSMLTDDDNSFRSVYMVNGIGTYFGYQYGTWTKMW